ncbi:hypothetical protein WJX79_002909 [Trebouxia sp. C0005]
MSCNHTDERVLRHLRLKHCNVGLSPTDQFVVEPRRASKKLRHPSSCVDAANCRVIVDVNGVTYKTTQQTLCSIKGSRFPDLLGAADYIAGGKKLCIDRNGQAFTFILEYLRAHRHSRNNFRLPSAEWLQAVVDEANFFQLSGLVQQLQQAMSPRRVSALQQTSTESHLVTQHSLNAPIKFATVQAAVSSHTPQLSQAQLQQLSQQVNLQVCIYTDRGFDIRDVGSGMTHAYGREGGEYILHITILLSASIPAVHDTAKLESLLSFATPESQQAFSGSDSISSSTDTVGSSSTLSKSNSTPRPDKGSPGSITQLRQRLHCSIAPDVVPSDTQPVTPDLAPKQPHLLPTSRPVPVQTFKLPVMYDSPVLGDHANKDSPGVWHSQGLAHFDLPDGLEDGYMQESPSDKYICNSPMSPLEWEYHAMMLNEHCLSERYPGMHSDARWADFDR